MERSRDPDQNLGEVGIDAPVVRLVGVGQSGARHFAAQAHVIKLAAHGSKARLDIAQTFTVGQLSETHRQQLVPTREASESRVAVIARDALLKFFAGQVLDQLRENGATDIHPPLFRSRR